MKNSTLLGGAASVLLLFSMISYSRTYIQQQDPKPSQANQPTAPQASPATATSEPTNAVSDPKPAPLADSGSEAPAATTEKSMGTLAAAAETYTATAYSLRGRTASGKPVARGLIAADPRVLPLGTRVRIEGGMFAGEYLVADTGGAVKGRRIDIWTPSTREAMQFGRRPVKLTVLEFGGKRAKNSAVRARRATPPAQSPVITEQPTKQN